MTKPNQSAKNRDQSWYETWIITLFRPTPERVKLLLSSSAISLRKAIVWLIVASIFYAALGKLTSFYNHHNLITSPNLFGLLGDIFLAAFIGMVGYFLFCGIIHLIAKLFKRKASLQDYFTVYSFFNSPFIIIGALFYFLWSAFRTPIGLLGGIFLQLYCLYWLNMVAIESVYDFSRGRAFLLNSVFTTLFVFAFFVLFFKGS